MIKYHEMEQKSDEWFDERNKHPFTASNATAIKTAGAGLETLCWQSVADRLSNVRDNFESEAMKRGNEQEALILSSFELQSGIFLKDIGFVTNSKYKLAGASPDSYTDEETVEVKSFGKVKYLKLLAEFKETKSFDIEGKYYDQIQYQMMIMEKDKGWFVVGNSDMKEPIIWKLIEKDLELHEKFKIGLAVGEQIIIKIEKKLCLKK